jgi:hypothetical protein
MLKSLLSTAALTALLAGPAAADDDDWRHRDRDRDRDRNAHRHDQDRSDWRPNWHHHPDWRWRRDGWRDHSRDHWRWRHVPPRHYRLDLHYRSGYELAWRDWHDHGRHDRYWRRSPRRHGFGGGYWAGYDAGWRDAASYYGRGYRPGYWAYDSRDGWFFGFHISG